MQTTNGTIARTVRFDLAKGKRKDFDTLFKTQVLPTMKAQNGFKDEILLVNDEHVVGISLWTNNDAALAYEKTIYPQVNKTLQPVMANAPSVETFEMTSLSTLA